MNDEEVKTNEARAIAFFSYKRTDGYEVSLTLRDDTGKAVLDRIEGAIALVKKEGGVPLPKYQSKGFNKPEKEYVEGRTCPIDQGRLVKPPVGSKAPIKCENNKWNPVTKQSEGCLFFEWQNQNMMSPVIQSTEDMQGA